jgi:hypothetical protein
MAERIVLLLSYLIKMTRIITTTIATTTPPIPPAIGSMLQFSPPEPQTSNIDPIAGGIDGVVVAIVVGVILVIFIR